MSYRNLGQNYRTGHSVNKDESIDCKWRNDILEEFVRLSTTDYVDHKDPKWDYYCGCYNTLLELLKRYDDYLLQMILQKLKKKPPGLHIGSFIEDCIRELEYTFPKPKRYKIEY
jgi:hypothetical protein